MNDTPPISHPVVTSRRYSLLTPMLIGMAAIAIGTGMLALRYVEQRLIASTGETLSVIAADIADKLEQSLFERYSDVRVFANAEQVKRKDLPAMTIFLNEMKAIYPFYIWLAVTDDRGKIIAATDPRNIGQDRSEREWFKSVRATGKVHVRDAQTSQDAGGRWAVAFTAPIKDASGKFLGVVTTRVGLDSLADVFRQSIHALEVQRKVPVHIEWQFLTRSGDVIVDSILKEEGRINLKQMGLPSALLSASAQPGYIEEMHIRRRVQVVTGYAETEQRANIFGLHWGVLVRIDRSDIIVPIRTVLVTLAMAGLVIILPLFVFLVWATRRLNREWIQAQEESARATAAEDMVRRSEERYRLLVEGATDIIYRTDAEGRFTFVNPEAVRLTKYSSEQLIGRRFAELIRADVRSDAQRFYGRQFVLKKISTYYEFPAVTKDGEELWLGQNVQLLFDGDKAIGYQAVARDITERKVGEAKRKEMDEQIQKAMKMKTDFVSFVSHQLRTPLAGMKWLLELAESNDRLSDETRAYVKDARECNERLIRLVNDLLDVSRLEAGKLTLELQTLDLAELTHGVLEEMRPLLREKEHDVAVEETETPRLVRADPQLLREVVMNLVSNAIKYTPVGGKITIALAQENGSIQWMIKDTGVGIPDAVHGQMFQKFFRADNVLTLETEGTGLGLYLVKMILERTGGRIWFESEEGKGSTFFFTLPADSTEAQYAPPEPGAVSRLGSMA